MGYDEQLANRIRQAFGTRNDITERKMSSADDGSHSPVTARVTSRGPMRPNNQLTTWPPCLKQRDRGGRSRGEGAIRTPIVAFRPQ
jgi:hypothetical protein